MIGQSSCTYQYQEICSHQACQNQLPFNHQIPISYPTSTSLAQPSNCNSRRNPTPIGPPRPNFNPTITPPSTSGQSQNGQAQQQQQQSNTTTSTYPTYPVSYLVQPPPPQPFNPMEFMRYYTMYNRIPVMPVQPVILHHPSNLQITHLNVATGFSPSPSSNNAPSTLTNANSNQNQNSACPNIAFGPPPRDRKNLTSIFDEQIVRSSCSDDAFNDGGLIDKDDLGSGLSKSDKLNDSLNSPSVSDENCSDVIQMSGPVDLKYIENFCVQAERIALKNQHRPCFKNIQHLCNRTRSDIMKPNTTVANIHSQGIPWALKDFIFAFIRLVNATHILHGYVDFKTGSLGKIENHLTTEFKTCYQTWEKMTKDQLIPAITKIILELDNLSNNSGTQSAIPKNSYTQTQSQNPNVGAQSAEDFGRSIRVKQLDLVPETVFSQRNVPGLLRVNLGETQSVSAIPTAADLNLSEEDSDAETSAYINPGTHKPLPRTLPIPHLLGQPNGVQILPGTSVEDTRDAVRDDKHWQSAIESIKQMQLLPGISGDDMKMFAEMETNPLLYSPQTVRASYLQAICGGGSSGTTGGATCDKEDRDQQDSFIKISLPEKSISKSDNDLLEFNGRDVTELSGMGIPDGEESASNDTVSPASPPGAIHPKVLLRHHQDAIANSLVNAEDASPAKKCIQSRTYRKRLDFDCQQQLSPQQCQQQPQQQPIFGKGSSAKKCHSSMMGSTWETRSNGLTEKAIKTFDKIVKELQAMDFGQHVANEKCLIVKGIERSMSIETISQKLWNHKYSNIRQVVHDVRLIIRNSRLFIDQGKADWIFEKELNAFIKRFNDLVTDYFRNIDFSDISGSPEEMYYSEMGRKNSRRIVVSKPQFEPDN